MTGRLVRLALVGATSTALLVSGAGPAGAADHISRNTCLADGGTFSTDKGYRICTVVITYDESLGVFSYRDPEEGTVFYRGELEQFITIRYTTVTTQRGNEEPSMTGGDEILDEWDEERCYFVEGATETLVDNSECESRGLL
ncbi:hypothetical protein [Actinotalea sp. Marseille-Q4924]|uniref:hypothetical protein n=1 Tax=Actinotalea sp. Marseille-Q4924 TaxID=2866571 RepID=UPI001CE3BEF9|nr:hypothetical protein [Actinotalea sp. Marseille-Q4924]